MENNILVAIQEMLNNLENRFDEKLNKLDNKFDTKINSLTEEVRTLSNNLAIHEIESDKKIQTLFDAFSMHDEKCDKMNGKIISLEIKLEEHEARIEELEKKVG